jgi:hypothetical protein
MPITPVSVDNLQELEAVITGPAGANRLFIYTGVAIFSFVGTGAAFRRDFIDFEIGRVFSPGQVQDVLATGSLNSIRNENAAVNAGWAVDRVAARWDPTDQRIRIRADLAVSDIDGTLFRMGFQATVRARL